jgi:FHA domain
VLEPVSVALKFGFLAVLYLFLLWVARSALKDLRESGARGGEEGWGDPGPPADATGFHAAADLGVAHDDVPHDPRLIVDHAVGHEAGTSYEVGGGATLGRGNVEIPLEDPFASSRHARIVAEGAVMVLEDLGSTNGTFLNGEPLTGPRPLHAGDRIRIGDSEFVYAQ